MQPCNAVTPGATAGGVMADGAAGRGGGRDGGGRRGRGNGDGDGRRHRRAPSAPSSLSSWGLPWSTCRREWSRAPSSCAYRRGRRGGGRRHRGRGGGRGRGDEGCRRGGRTRWRRCGRSRCRDRHRCTDARMLERPHVPREQGQRTVLGRLVGCEGQGGLRDRFGRLVTLLYGALDGMQRGVVVGDQVGRRQPEILLRHHTVLGLRSVLCERLGAAGVHQRGARVQPAAHVLTDGESLEGLGRVTERRSAPP